MESSVAKSEIREALIRSVSELRSQFSKLTTEVQQCVNADNEEELSYTLEVVEEMKESAANAMKRLTEKNGAERRLRKDSNFPFLSRIPHGRRVR